jgi:transcription antitermination factor NusG
MESAVKVGTKVRITAGLWDGYDGEVIRAHPDIDGRYLVALPDASGNSVPVRLFFHLHSFEVVT